MPTYPVSIGEPEGSQDTPFRNTTPLGKRQRRPDIGPNTPKKAKKRKMNQCQMSFFQILKCSVNEYKFDAHFNLIDERLNAMDKSLDNDKACIQDTKEDDEELLQLVQELENKSKAAQQSTDVLRKGVHKFDILSGGQQSRRAGGEIPEYDAHQDSLLVRSCTTALNERADAFKTATVDTDKVKRQIENFKNEFEQARAGLSGQVGQLRLEYEARLSQQRRELKQETRESKENFDNLLEQKQKIIDNEMIRAREARVYGQSDLDQQMKSALKEKLVMQITTEWSSKLAAANEATAELSLRLASSENVKRDTKSQLAAVGHTVDALTRENAEWKEHARDMTDGNERLRNKLSRAEADYTAKMQSANERLHKTSQELQGTRRSLLTSEASAQRTRKRLDLTTSDYATLLIHVAWVQKDKLAVAREEKLHLKGYLAKARSKVDALERATETLEKQLKGKITQVERRSQRLEKVERLLEFKTKSLEYTDGKLEAERNKLEQKNKSILVHQISIQQLNKRNMELDAALKARDGLTSNATEIANKSLEAQHLTDQESNTAELLAV